MIWYQSLVGPLPHPLLGAVQAAVNPVLTARVTRLGESNRLRMERARKRMYDLLTSNWVTTLELSDKLGVTQDNVRRVIKKMVADDIVESKCEKSVFYWRLRS